MDGNTFVSGIINFFSVSGVNLLIAILAFVIGYVVIKIALKITARILAKSKVEKSARKFLLSLLKYVLYFILLTIIASILGINATGLIAVLSAAGLAVSLALQGSLSNLANGIVIIVSKPFKAGDYIALANSEGVVKEIKLTHTILTSPDNKEISIPNKLVVDSVILNSSVLQNKKITYKFLVGYSSDVDKVKNIILSAFEKTNLILQDPKPVVVLESLESNGLKFSASAYVESRNYATIYSPMLEYIFNELKRAKIVLPQAQLEVKVKQEKDNHDLPVSNNIVLPKKEVVVEKPKPVKDVVEEPVEEVEEVEKDDDVEVVVEKEYLEYNDEVEIIEPVEGLPEVVEHKEEVFEEENLEEHKTENKKSFGKNLFKRKPVKEKKQPIVIKKK